MVLFDIMSCYKIKTGKYPNRWMPMFVEIESTAMYLIEVAEDNNLNMVGILNWVAEDGKTLFWKAAIYSESLAKDLLKRNVVVTTVDDLFRIPSFQVSSMIC